MSSIEQFDPQQKDGNPPEDVSQPTDSSEYQDTSPRMDIPRLKDVHQVSDGWIKKYVLTYTMPDGSIYEYESASRKNLEAYRRGLESNAAALRATNNTQDAVNNMQGAGTTPTSSAPISTTSVTAHAADAVCIVPQTSDEKLLLIREFRYPINSWCIAFPAGLMEPEENLAECVNRELREETGYALRADLGTKAIAPLPQAGLSSTGLTDETVHVVFAQVKKISDAQPEPSEFIEPFLLAIDDVPQFLAENTTPIGTRAQLVLELFAHRH